jgi:hypothetical protein
MAVETVYDILNTYSHMYLGHRLQGWGNCNV